MPAPCFHDNADAVALDAAKDAAAAYGMRRVAVQAAIVHARSMRERS